MEQEATLKGPVTRMRSGVLNTPERTLRSNGSSTKAAEDTPKRNARRSTIDSVETPTKRSTRASSAQPEVKPSPAQVSTRGRRRSSSLQPETPKKEATSSASAKRSSRLSTIPVADSPSTRTRSSSANKSTPSPESAKPMELANVKRVTRSSSNSPSREIATNAQVKRRSSLLRTISPAKSPDLTDAKTSPNISRRKGLKNTNLSPVEEKNDDTAVGSLHLASDTKSEPNTTPKSTIISKSKDKNTIHNECTVKQEPVSPVPSPNTSNAVSSQSVKLEILTPPANSPRGKHDSYTESEDSGIKEMEDFNVAAESNFLEISGELTKKISDSVSEHYEDQNNDPNVTTVEPTSKVAVQQLNKALLKSNQQNNSAEMDSSFSKIPVVRLLKLPVAEMSEKTDQLSKKENPIAEEGTVKYDVIVSSTDKHSETVEALIVKENIEVRNLKESVDMDDIRQLNSIEEQKKLNTIVSSHLIHSEGDKLKMAEETIEPDKIVFIKDKDCEKHKDSTGSFQNNDRHPTVSPALTDKDHQTEDAKTDVEADKSNLVSGSTVRPSLTDKEHQTQDDETDVEEVKINQVPSNTVSPKLTDKDHQKQDVKENTEETESHSNTACTKNTEEDYRTQNDKICSIETIESFNKSFSSTPINEDLEKQDHAENIKEAETLKKSMSSKLIDENLKSQNDEGNPIKETESHSNIASPTAVDEKRNSQNDEETERMSSALIDENIKSQNDEQNPIKETKSHSNIAFPTAVDEKRNSQNDEETESTSSALIIEGHKSQEDNSSPIEGTESCDIASPICTDEVNAKETDDNAKNDEESTAKQSESHKIVFPAVTDEDTLNTLENIEATESSNKMVSSSFAEKHHQQDLDTNTSCDDIEQNDNLDKMSAGCDEEGNENIIKLAEVPANKIPDDAIGKAGEPDEIIDSTDDEVETSNCGKPSAAIECIEGSHKSENKIVSYTVDEFESQQEVIENNEGADRNLGNNVKEGKPDKELFVVSEKWDNFDSSLEHAQSDSDVKIVEQRITVVSRIESFKTVQNEDKLSDSLIVESSFRNILNLSTFEDIFDETNEKTERSVPGLDRSDTEMSNTSKIDHHDLSTKSLTKADVVSPDSVQISVEEELSEKSSVTCRVGQNECSESLEKKNLVPDSSDITLNESLVVKLDFSEEENDVAASKQSINVESIEDEEFASDDGKVLEECKSVDSDESSSDTIEYPWNNSNTSNRIETNEVTSGSEDSSVKSLDDSLENVSPHKMEVNEKQDIENNERAQETRSTSDVLRCVDNKPSNTLNPSEPVCQNLVSQSGEETDKFREESEQTSSEYIDLTGNSESSNSENSVSDEDSESVSCDENSESSPSDDYSESLTSSEDSVSSMSYDKPHSIGRCFIDDEAEEGDETSDEDVDSSESEIVHYKQTTTSSKPIMKIDVKKQFNNFIVEPMTREVTSIKFQVKKPVNKPSFSVTSNKPKLSSDNILEEKLAKRKRNTFRIECTPATVKTTAVISGSKSLPSKIEKSFPQVSEKKQGKKPVEGKNTVEPAIKFPTGRYGVKFPISDSTVSDESKSFNFKKTVEPRTLTCCGSEFTVSDESESFDIKRIVKHRKVVCCGSKFAVSSESKYLDFKRTVKPRKVTCSSYKFTVSDATCEMKRTGPIDSLAAVSCGTSFVVTPLRLEPPTSTVLYPSVKQAAVSKCEIDKTMKREDSTSSSSVGGNSTYDLKTRHNKTGSLKFVSHAVLVNGLIDGFPTVDHASLASVGKKVRETKSLRSSNYIAHIHLSSGYIYDAHALYYFLREKGICKIEEIILQPTVMHLYPDCQSSGIIEFSTEEELLRALKISPKLVFEGRKILMTPDRSYNPSNRKIKK